MGSAPSQDTALRPHGHGQFQEDRSLTFGGSVSKSAVRARSHGCGSKSTRGRLQGRVRGGPTDPSWTAGLSHLQQHAVAGSEDRLDRGNHAELAHAVAIREEKLRPAPCGSNGGRERGHRLQVALLVVEDGVRKAPSRGATQRTKDATTPSPSQPSSPSFSTQTPSRAIRCRCGLSRKHDPPADEVLDRCDTLARTTNLTSLHLAVGGPG